MSDKQTNTLSPRPAVEMQECLQCGNSHPAHERYCVHCGAPTLPEAEEAWQEHILAGKYRLLEKIGSGGMGTIYRAEHVLFQEPRAVKILAEELADQRYKRYIREIRLTRQASRESEHIVYIHDDFGHEPGFGYYYVMEYLAGRPLSDLLREGTLPDVARVVHIIVQICEGMAAAHRQGIVHRDLKPDNILLLDYPNEPEFAKIIDFGIARPLESQSTGTRFGEVIGTPEYMSPEQCRGPSQEQYQRKERYLDGRSDIYSLGVILYQLLTGRVPYPMEGTASPMALMEVLNAHIHKQLPPPSSIRSDGALSPLLEQVLLKALDKDPAARFSTMEEFSEALLQVVPEGAPPSPLPTRAASRTPRPFSPLLPNATPPPTPRSPSSPATPAPEEALAAQDSSSLPSSPPDSKDLFQRASADDLSLAAEARAETMDAPSHLHPSGEAVFAAPESLAERKNTEAPETDRIRRQQPPKRRWWLLGVLALMMIVGILGLRRWKQTRGTSGKDGATPSPSATKDQGDKELRFPTGPLLVRWITTPRPARVYTERFERYLGRADGRALEIPAGIRRLILVAPDCCPRLLSLRPNQKQSLIYLKYQGHRQRQCSPRSRQLLRLYRKTKKRKR